MIKFVKTNPLAKLPKYKNEDHLTGDAGADLYAVESKIIPARGSAVIDVGLKVGSIRTGYFFTIETRSGLGFNHSLMVHRGIIDPSYTGELSVKLYNHSDTDYNVYQGDRIAQIVVQRLTQFEFGWIEQEEVKQTARGEGGFGSTGR